MQVSKIFLRLIFCLLLSGLPLQAQADLFVRGIDGLGNRLIYDSDLNITWYDYTNAGASLRGFGDTWQNQMNWASALVISGGDLNGVYDDWRLPTTVDGPYVYGYDGSTTGGYNITSNEIGHLFYSELRNNGYLDINGNTTGCASGNPPCLTNTGPFQNLQTVGYVSSTEFAANSYRTWLFNMNYGILGNGFKEADDSWGIAVHSGDISVVPEPVSSLLFITGAVFLGFRRFRAIHKK